jgi:hypothetical protein
MPSSKDGNLENAISDVQQIFFHFVSFSNGNGDGFGLGVKGVCDGWEGWNWDIGALILRF